MSHTLRNFQQEDASGVKNLIISILADEYPIDRAAYSDTDLERILDVYGGKNECFFVIEEDGLIVGTAGIKRESKDEALLRRLFVDPCHRNMGYGSQLLKSAIKFCRDNGYRKIFFRCTDRMINAMKLCEKEGFTKKETLQISGFYIHKLELSI